MAKLFTPGPLSTSVTVKAAMQTDYGSRDDFFVNTIKEVRQGVLDLANLDNKVWSMIPMQGSGTMGIEAAVGTTTPRKNGKYLVVRSGKYAERMGDLVVYLGITPVFFDVEEGVDIDLAAFEAFLKTDACTGLTNVGMVHSETSTGMLNPIDRISQIVRKTHPSAVIIIDAMSSFGGVPIDVDKVCDILVTSSNKCIHGVPGFSVILARRALIAKCKDVARSFTLDLYMQVTGLDKSGQFPYTPPVHTIVAFGQALKEHRAEGGVAGRAARYKKNAEAIVAGMTGMGFQLFLDRSKPSSGNIIIAFLMPSHPKWNFMTFYAMLRKQDLVIYPGKASKKETFRIGCIGHIDVKDVQRLMAAVRDALKQLGVDLLAANSKTASKL
jgi:2-aminoethylphosphonate-pyruvate transaminase